MSDDIVGGGWQGGGQPDGNGIDRGLLEYFAEHGKNGIVVDGVVAWIEIQQGRTGDEIWKAQAEARYDHQEITHAKKALWDASETTIGYSAPVRIGDSKKTADIDDIHKALQKLKCGNVLPLILASSRMVARSPVFGGITEDSSNGDIVNKIGVLEDAMKSYMKQTNEQLKTLTEVVGTVGQVGSSRTSFGNPAVDKVICNSMIVDSPSKKRKTPDNGDMEVEAEEVFENTVNTVSYANIASAPKHFPANVGQVTGINKIKPPGIQPSGTPQNRRKPSIM